MASNLAAQALALHKRLLAGDPIASAQLVALLLGPTTGYLAKKYAPTLDKDLLGDIATDALMAYLKAPERFDPQRAGLPHYIRVIAGGDAQDALRKLRRRPQYFVPIVQDDESLANNPIDDIERRIDSVAILERYGDEICFNETDKAVLALILKGEDSTAVFARELGLSNLPKSEAEARVAQAKDRIIKRLQRLRKKIEGRQ